MRWSALVLSLTLLLATVPTSQAATSCARQEIVPIDGLEEASIRLCDGNGDGLPDTYDLRVPTADLQIAGEAGDEAWGHDRQATVQTGVTAGYPVAPTVEVDVQAVDDDSDGTRDRLYLVFAYNTALPGDRAFLWVGLEDVDQDGQFESARLFICTMSTGCFFATNPFAIVGVLLGSVPIGILDVVPIDEVPGPSGLLPDNLP